MPFDAFPSTEALDAEAQRQDDLRLLRHCRDEIAAGRWIQHELADRQGNRCAVGHLLGVAPGAVFFKSDDPHPAQLALVRRLLVPALPQSWPHFNHSSNWIALVAEYNDTHSRRTIVRLFDRAIALREQQP